MNPEKAFFEQFPRGCPSCGGSRRFVVFTELTHSGVLPWIWIPVAHLNRVIAEGRPAHFAECQVCHEAWVWKRETETWVELGKLERKHNARP